MGKSCDGCATNGFWNFGDSDPAKTVSAEKFELKDAKGEVRAVFALGASGEPGLFLRCVQNPNADAMISFGQGSPIVRLRNKDAAVIARVTDCGELHFSRDGGGKLTIAFDDDGGPVVAGEAADGTHCDF